MTDEVHVGRDGWLFLTGGANTPLRYFTEADYFAEPLGQWLDLLRERQRTAARFGAVYKHLIAPDKLSVMPEFFQGALDGDLAPARALPRAARNAGLESAVIDALPRMLAAKLHAQLYYRTDTHWTFDGAAEAYREVCAQLGAPPNEGVIAAPRNSGEIALDLGAKLDPPVLETFVAPELPKQAERHLANEMVQFKESQGLDNEAGLHVGSGVAFRNAHAADKRRVILFGDSFAEYRPYLLTGLLAETFAEVAFAWSASIDWGLVERFKPDIILTELAERFMTQVPTDDIRLHVFSAQRLAQYRQSHPAPPPPAAPAAPAAVVADAKPADVFKGFESVRQHPAATGPVTETISVAGDPFVFQDAVISLRAGPDVLFSGIGLKNCSVATYRQKGDGVVAEFRLPNALLAKAFATGARTLSVISSVSPYPLGSFSLDQPQSGALAADHLALLRSRLHRSQWDVETVFLAGGKAHVLGFALAPVGETAETPEVWIDGAPAELVQPTYASHASRLYWFTDRPDFVSFHAVGAMATTEAHFLKVEIRLPGDPAPGDFWRRFPVYTWTGGHAGMVLPPAANIHRVSGTGANATTYLNGGYTDFKRFEWAAGRFGRGFAPGTRVLDWGCGCGRLSRHVIDTGATVTGIDIDSDNVGWCSGALAGGAFQTVPLMPPTGLADDGFDVIMSSSVLSHLQEQPMHAWLSELHRVLAPDGVALLSYNGDATSFVYGGFDPNIIGKLASDGFFADWRSSDLDGFIDDREYYRLTFMTDARAEQIFRRHFDLVGVIGSVTSGHQNIAVLRKRRR